MQAGYLDQYLHTYVCCLYKRLCTYIVRYKIYVCECVCVCVCVCMCVCAQGMDAIFLPEDGLLSSSSLSSVCVCVCVYRETEEENLMLVDLNLAGFPKHVSC